MELKDLRYFCLAAELGSITRAAETLGVSQPFVTKVINRLEEELGTQLFDINKRRIVLNANGEMFYKGAKDIVDRADTLVGDMLAMQDQAEFTTNLLYNNAGYLSALNSAFMTRFPNCILSESYANRKDIIEKLNTGTADFAIALPPITQNESKMIETVTVLRDTGSIMVPPDHPLFDKDVVTLEDIAPYPIVIAPKGSGMRDTIDAIFAKHGLVPNVVYETNDMDLQQRAVLVDKRGIAFMSAIHVKDPLISRYCRKTQTDHAFGTVGLSYNKYRPFTESMKEFKTFAVGFFAELQRLIDSI